MKIIRERKTKNTNKQTNKQAKTEENKEVQKL